MLVNNVSLGLMSRNKIGQKVPFLIMRLTGKIKNKKKSRRLFNNKT
jgi:hypothetical protein